MTGIAISADQLGKRYRIGGERRYFTLRDSIARAARRLTRWKPAPAAEPFWALRDLSFEVRAGEVLGIIGRNGAGKSTLLKILARVTEPSVGSARLTGRVGSLLEIGAGFHPELTGRENIYLNGAVLGMSRGEIAGKFDQIVAFSEVERFLDTAVKHFSTGMFMRLAFSVAAHLESEILLMDEALAVGDATFTNKCLLRLRDAARDGRTVLLVSHNMHAISRLCSRAILLDQGRMVLDGPAAQVIDAYQQRSARSGPAMGLTDRIVALPEDPSFRLLGVRCLQGGVETASIGNGEPVSLSFTYRVKRPIAGFRLAFDLCEAGDAIVFRSHHDDDAESIATTMPGDYESTAVVPADLLAPRSYQVVVRATEYNIRHLIPEGALSFPLLVRGSGRVNRAYIGDAVHGLISPMIPWDHPPGWDVMNRREPGRSIAFITSEYVTERISYGGLANYLQRVALALASIGWRPHIVVAADEDGVVDRGPITVHRVDVRWPVPLRAINRATFGAFARTLALLWQSWRLNRRLRRLRRAHRFAIVQYSHLGATGMFRPRALAAVARISGHQRLWAAAGDGWAAGDHHDRQQHRLELFALRRMDSVYSPSSLLARIWMRELHRPVATLENPFVLDPIEEDRSLLRHLEGRDYVLFFGALTAMKGVAVIAEMIGPWLDRRPGLVFAFAGRDSEFAGRSMAQHLRDRAGPSRDRVVHLGIAPHAQLYPIVARARAVVLPSLIDNFPNACLEALAHGRVVVTTRGSGMDQLIVDGQTGIICDRGDPASLAAALDRALALDPAEAEAMGLRARRRIDLLAPQRAGQELTRFYHAVVRSGGRRSGASRPIG